MITTTRHPAPLRSITISNDDGSQVNIVIEPTNTVLFLVDDATDVVTTRITIEDFTDLANLLGEIRVASLQPF